jgi:hypothetical protein
MMNRHHYMWVTVALNGKHFQYAHVNMLFTAHISNQMMKHCIDLVPFSNTVLFSDQSNYITCTIHIWYGS